MIIMGALAVFAAIAGLAYLALRKEIRDAESPRFHPPVKRLVRCVGGDWDGIVLVLRPQDQGEITVMDETYSLADGTLREVDR